jgi:hypothetical protein
LLRRQVMGGAMSMQHAIRAEAGFWRLQFCGIGDLIWHKPACRFCIGHMR